MDGWTKIDNKRTSTSNNKIAFEQETKRRKKSWIAFAESYLFELYVAHVVKRTRGVIIKALFNETQWQWPNKAKTQRASGYVYTILRLQHWFNASKTLDLVCERVPFCCCIYFVLKDI